MALAGHARFRSCPHIKYLKTPTAWGRETAVKWRPLHVLVDAFACLVTTAHSQLPTLEPYPWISIPGLVPVSALRYILPAWLTLDSETLILRDLKPLFAEVLSLPILCWVPACPSLFRFSLALDTSHDSCSTWTKMCGDFWSHFSPSFP